MGKRKSPIPSPAEKTEPSEKRLKIPTAVIPLRRSERIAKLPQNAVAGPSNWQANPAPSENEEPEEYEEPEEPEQAKTNKQQKQPVTRKASGKEKKEIVHRRITGLSSDEEPAEPEPEPAKGPLSLRGWFRVVEQGAGGEGTADLYQSETDPNNLMIVKWCRIRTDYTIREQRFLTAAAGHRNILPLLSYSTKEVGLEPGTGMLWLPYCNGADLEMFRYFYASRRLPVPEASLWVILRDILRGLVWLHAENRGGVIGHPMIHRDIKPGNILLKFTPTSSQPTAVIADFGCAVSASHASRRVDFSGGTQNWWPPEFLESAYSDLDPDESSKHHNLCDPTTDVWGAAACIAYLAFGQSPLDHRHRRVGDANGRPYPRNPQPLNLLPGNRLEQQLNRSPNGAWEGMYSNALNWIVMEMLSMNRAVRPTAAQALRRLENALRSLNIDLDRDAEDWDDFADRIKPSTQIRMVMPGHIVLDSGAWVRASSTWNRPTAAQMATPHPGDERKHIRPVAHFIQARSRGLS